MLAQDNWRWCNKCQALCFAGNATLGPCPEGGVHDHGGSGDYGLVQNDAAVPGQHNWRWCNKCQALCFTGDSLLGACKAGGVHDHAGSGDYVLGQKQQGTVGQDNWRWCNKCQELTFAGSASLGKCPGGGMHDHTGSGNYLMAQVTDCSGLFQQFKSLEQQVQDIQSSPGYIQGPDDPHPGKPDPEMLAEVKALLQQVAILESQYNACMSANDKQVLSSLVPA